VHTASINALAAADFLLIPVLLDLTSSLSAPRMLEWMKLYRKAGICPNLKILGIVANKKSDRRSNLLERENKIWGELPDRCKEAWEMAVTLCETVIPNSSAIADCAQTPGRLACEDPRIRDVFLKLAEELEKVIWPDGVQPNERG
jgi:cellulose biosynthesis protein BcsQ